MVTIETMQKILLDIGNGVAPEKSTRVVYGPEELAFRQRAEQRFAKYREQHPNAILDIKE